MPIILKPFFHGRPRRVLIGNVYVPNTGTLPIVFDTIDSMVGLRLVDVGIYVHVDIRA